MSSQSSRKRRSTTLTSSEAKERYGLVDKDLEIIIPFSGGEGDEEEGFSIWAVLQLAAAVKANLRYDGVVSGRQASTTYGLGTKRLKQLKPVAYMSNPVSGGVLPYYKVSDVEAQTDLCSSEKVAPRQGRDITQYFPSRKSTTTAGLNSQKSRIRKSTSNATRQ